ncbi:hypothetical protein ACTXJR_05740 [Glutamicibacter ardleyensis]
MNPANWSEGTWLTLIMLGAPCAVYGALVIAILGLNMIAEAL